MPQKFSPKKYFSKIYAVDLLKELYQKHGETMFIEVNEQTPRKTAIDMILESFNNLEIEKKSDIQKDLAYISSFSNSNFSILARKLFKDIKGLAFEPEIQCASDHDLTLYFFLRHNELISELIFLNEFYLSKTYLSYEAKNYNKETLSLDVDELAREFKRIANKEDNATDCEFTWKELDGVLYVRSVFEGSHELSTKIDPKTGEVDRANTRRRIETIRIACVPKEKVVLISGTLDKNQKLIFLDTFLRIICKSGHDGKVDTYDLSIFKNLSLDFMSINKGTPLMKWKVKNITFSYKDGKKKLRLSLNSDANTVGMAPLSETLSEISLNDGFKTFEIESASISFTFNDKEKEGKVKSVNCSISKNKTSLCPLFEYDNYAMNLLRLGGVSKGFVLVEK